MVHAGLVQVNNAQDYDALRFGLSGEAGLALNHGLIGTNSAVVVNLTLSVIALSIVVHGLSTQPMLAWYERRAKVQGQS